MKIKYKVMFKNGKVKTYKSKHVSCKECKNGIIESNEFWKECFKKNHDGYFTIQKNILRISDVSSIRVSKTLL